MRRGKLPAYGRDLITLRNNGQHPHLVWVLVGDDWARRPAGAPALCVPTANKGADFDWSIVSGLPAHVVDRGGDLFGVAAAIAEHAAPVTLHWVLGEDCWPVTPGTRMQEDVVWAMFWLREQTKTGFVFRHGWSDERQADYAARKARYLDALFRDLGEQEKIAS